MLFHKDSKKIDFSTALDMYIHQNYEPNTIYRARYVSDSMKDSVVYFPSYVKRNSDFVITGVQLNFVDAFVKATTQQLIIAFSNDFSDVIYEEQIKGYDQIDELHKKVSLVENELKKSIHTKSEDKSKKSSQEQEIVWLKRSFYKWRKKKEVLIYQKF